MQLAKAFSNDILSVSSDNTEQNDALRVHQSPHPLSAAVFMRPEQKCVLIVSGLGGLNLTNLVINQSNYATVLTQRSKAKERQNKDETIKQQTSYLAITEFSLIIGC